MSREGILFGSTDSVYRLHYLYFERSKSAKKKSGVEMRDFSFIHFVAPDGLSEEETFKVVSYISDMVGKEYDLPVCSLASVRATDEMLNTFKFRRLHEAKVKKITEIFTVQGDLSQFKDSQYNGKWVAWYTPNVKKEEVEEIYANHNLKFPNYVFEQKERKMREEVKR